MPTSSKPSVDLEPTEAGPRILVPLSRYRKTGDGHLKIQSTKPQTLVHGLANSHVGLGAHILKKLIDWSAGDPLTTD